MPDGIGAEIILAHTLQNVHTKAIAPEDREHVTRYVHCHPEEFRIVYLKASKDLWDPDLRLDVDYPEDLLFLRELCKKLAIDAAPYLTTAQIFEVIKAQPDLLKLRHQRS